MTRLRLLLAIAFGLLLVLTAGSCLSPTLPLPPPEEPDLIEQSADGVWDIRGSNTPGSLVIVRNLDNGVIVGVHDKNEFGRYFVQLEAELCDQAEVFEIVEETEVSSPTRFFVQPSDEPVCD